MALQKNIEKQVINKTVIFEDAYIKIANITGNKELLLVTVEILTEVYGDIIKIFEFKFVPEENELSTRWDKQAYEYLKTTDEFADAVDV